MRLIPKENHLIREAYHDFILSRRAASLSDATIVFYDTGLGRSEVLYLDWPDVDLASGVVNVRSTKNKKARSVFIGAKTRRALLKYRRTISHGDKQPLFQSVSGRRFKSSGLRQVFRRINAGAGIKFSAHDLRELSPL